MIPKQVFEYISNGLSIVFWIGVASILLALGIGIGMGMLL